MVVSYAAGGVNKARMARMKGLSTATTGGATSARYATSMAATCPAHSPSRRITRGQSFPL
jgi:hypothetical protein